MPYSLSQMFTNGRGSNDVNVDKFGSRLRARRRSTGSLKHGNVRKNLTEFPNHLSTRKLSHAAQAPKKLVVTRQRSHTIHNLPAKIACSPTSKRSAIQDPNLPSPDYKHKNAFYDLAWSIVSARRLRSSSVSSQKRKNCKQDLPPSSPLVTISNYRNLLLLSHSSMTNGERRTQSQSTSSDTASEGCSSTTEDDYCPASVENLVRKCTECFDETGSCSNENFLRTFFLSHLWFMTSEQLMVLFSQLYEEEKNTKHYRKKIFFSIRFWLQAFPHMFDLDQQLVSALEDFQKKSLDDADVDSTIIDLSNKNSFQWMSEANMSVRPHQISRKGRKVSLVFNHLEPEDIAVHMSYLEYKSFRRLTLSDFHSYVVHGVIKDNVKLERAIVLFNNITQWVQCMILDHHKPQERAQAIVKFIEIAKNLYAMRNFNTLMAVVGALTHTAISRMKKTMAAVPKDALKVLDEFIELLDSKSNYSSYRKAYGQVTEEFKIPIIGILMKDLISLHAALADRVGDGLINVRKMMLIGEMFQELIRLQTTVFPYDINHDLLNTLRVSLYLYYSEEEVYERSLMREPRDAKQSVSGIVQSPAKGLNNMGFAEFASFTCQLDEETIKHHVTAMVNSVFKTYDENSDGFICEAEFDHFIKNFPGLDSFSIVDKDQDGRISLAEMIDYFLKISSSRRNQIFQGFKHDFIETTYFHPTFCEECKKLLWGLVKQGWKCKDCGINCHKHCKERIVLECRLKTSTKSTTPTPKKKLKQRTKTSVSSESDSYSANGDPSRTNDDDAFSSNDVIKSPVSAKLVRPSSFATADVTSSPSRFRRADESKLLSKTPSPTRKFSSPSLNHEFGKKTIQRKVQKMLKKKISSKSFFPGKRIEKQSKSEIADQQAPVLEESCNELDEKELEDCAERSSVTEPATKPEPAASATNQISELQHFSFASQPQTKRRDSGLSSCGSCLTSTPVSTSAPVTPSYFDYPSGTDLQFQYPSTSSSKINTRSCGGNLHDITNNNVVQKNLLEENLKLRQENEELQKKLLQANEVIKELEADLYKLKDSTAHGAEVPHVA